MRYYKQDIEVDYGYETHCLLKSHGIAIYVLDGGGSIIEHGSGPLKLYSYVSNANPFYCFAYNIDEAIETFSGGWGKPWLVTALPQED